MSFTFICPNCRQKLEAEEEWLGMEAECPGCGKKIIVQKTVVLRMVNGATHKASEGQRAYIFETPASNPTAEKSKAIQDLCSLLERYCEQRVEHGKADTFQVLSGQPQSRYHLCPSPMEGKTEATSPSQGLPPSEPSVPPPKSEESPASPEGATNNKESKKKDDGCGGMVVLLVIIGIVAWLGWLGLSHWPRLSFWLLAPVTGVIVLANSGKIPKLVTVLLCAGIVFWGWFVHPFSFRTVTVSNVWVYADRIEDDMYRDDLESYTFRVYVDNKLVVSNIEYSHGIGYIPSYYHFENPIKVRKGAKIKANVIIKIKRMGETTLTGYYPKVTEDLDSIQIHCR